MPEETAHGPDALKPVVPGGDSKVPSNKRSLGDRIPDHDGGDSIGANAPKRLKSHDATSRLDETAERDASDKISQERDRQHNDNDNDNDDHDNHDDDDDDDDDDNADFDDTLLELEDDEQLQFLAQHLEKVSESRFDHPEGTKVPENQEGDASENGARSGAESVAASAEKAGPNALDIGDRAQANEGDSAQPDPESELERDGDRQAEAEPALGPEPESEATTVAAAAAADEDEFDAQAIADAQAKLAEALKQGETEVEADTNVSDKAPAGPRTATATSDASITQSQSQAQQSPQALRGSKRSPAAQIAHESQAFQTPVAAATAPYTGQNSTPAHTFQQTDIYPGFHLNLPPRNDPLFVNKVHSLPILDNLSTQILQTIAQPQELLVAAITEPSSPEGLAFSGLIQLLTATKQIYTEEPFLTPESIGENLCRSKRQRAVLQRANLATFVSSILGAVKVGFFHLNKHFLDTFLVENGRLLKVHGALYLELKTQAFISALRTRKEPNVTPQLVQDVIAEVFPANMEQLLLARRQHASSLTPNEADFVTRCRSRSDNLANCKSTEELADKYEWLGFVRDVCEYVTKNATTLFNVQALNIYPATSASTQETNGYPYGSQYSWNSRHTDTVSQRSTPPNNALGTSATTIGSGREAVEATSVVTDSTKIKSEFQPQAQAQAPTQALSQTHSHHQNQLQNQHHAQHHFQSQASQAATTAPPPNSNQATHISIDDSGNEQVYYSPVYSTSNKSYSRRHWSKEEEEALLHGMEKVKGPYWSQILELHGAGGTISEELKDRTQVQLKDKARNLKVSYIKNGQAIPPVLHYVTGDIRRFKKRTQNQSEDVKLEKDSTQVHGQSHVHAQSTAPAQSQTPTPSPALASSGSQVQASAQTEAVTAPRVVPEDRDHSHDQVPHDQLPQGDDSNNQSKVPPTQPQPARSQWTQTTGSGTADPDAPKQGNSVQPRGAPANSGATATPEPESVQGPPAAGHGDDSAVADDAQKGTDGNVPAQEPIATSQQQEQQADHADGAESSTGEFALPLGDDDTNLEQLLQSVGEFIKTNRSEE